MTVGGVEGDYFTSESRFFEGQSECTSIGRRFIVVKNIVERARFTSDSDKE